MRESEVESRVHLSSWTWQAFRWATRPIRKRRGLVLSYCGPIILVLLVLVWGFGLTLGSALIIHPRLGKSVLATDGPTSTDFGTAMFVGGSSLAIVGSSDFVPKTRAYRWFFFGNSLMGMSVMFLTTTYVLQVYTALQNRNALALKVHLGARKQADAAELVVGLGPRGKFEIGYSTLAEMAGELTHVKESHHFYPVVFYFRFETSLYSVSRLTLLVFDTVSLLKTALQDETYAWLKESCAVSQRLGRLYAFGENTERHLCRREIARSSASTRRRFDDSLDSPLFNGHSTPSVGWYPHN